MVQIGKVEHFQSGDDWESYEEHLQQYSTTNNITKEEKKVAVFLTIVGSHLYKLLRNLQACREIIWRIDYSVKAASGAHAVQANSYT